MRLPAPPLLLVTDRRQARGSLDDILAAAFAAGCRWASIREKDLLPSEQVALARRLASVAVRHGARLMLHGDAELAREAGLSAVHLSAGSDALAARRVLGPDALIGISVHDAAELRGLDPSVVDYAMAGPFAETASKPGYGPALGPGGLAALASTSPVALLAIGGITAGNVMDVRVAGASGAAVMGEVMRAADPGAVVSGLLRALAQPRPR